jgi:hypothetical protein
MFLFVSSVIAKLCDQALQEKLDRLAVAEEGRIDNVSSINDVGSRLIDEKVAGSFVPHGHAIEAFCGVANKMSVERPRRLDEQAVIVPRPSCF